MSFSIEEMLIPTFRYYLGRKTISVHTFISDLMDYWHEVTPSHKALIIREIKEHKELDLLGHQMDVAAWCDLLAFAESKSESS
jgi:uncharacterized membrane protein YpjA